MFRLIVQCHRLVKAAWKVRAANVLGAAALGHVLAMTSQGPGGGGRLRPGSRGDSAERLARVRGPARVCPGFLFALAARSSRRRPWLSLCGLFRLGTCPQLPCQHGLALGADGTSGCRVRARISGSIAAAPSELIAWHRYPGVFSSRTLVTPAPSECRGAWRPCRDRRCEGHAGSKGGIVPVALSRPAVADLPTSRTLCWLVPSLQVCFTCLTDS